MRARTLSLAVTCVLIAASTTVEGSAHAAKQKQTRRTLPKRTLPKRTVSTKPPTQQQRQVSQGELNSFLRSPAGKAKLKVYKQQAFDAPRLVAHPKGERPLGSLRQLHHVYKSSGRLIKIFSYASAVVTGAMGAFLGGTIGLWTGGMPTGPEMLQNPGTHPAVHFLTQGHVVIGALVGAGAAIATGTLVAAGFKRSARKVDKQAENEAVLRILGELQSGIQNQPPQPHPGFPANGGVAGAGPDGQNSILNDFFGGPGALWGPQQSASNQAAMRDGISDVGPSGFDSFGSPGGPP